VVAIQVVAIALSQIAPLQQPPLFVFKGAKAVSKRDLHGLGRCQ